MAFLHSALVIYENWEPRPSPGPEYFCNKFKEFALLQKDTVLAFHKAEREKFSIRFFFSNPISFELLLLFCRNNYFHFQVSERETYDGMFGHSNECGWQCSSYPKQLQDANQVCQDFHRLQWYPPSTQRIIYRLSSPMSWRPKRDYCHKI